MEILHPQTQLFAAVPAAASTMAASIGGEGRKMPKDLALQWDVAMKQQFSAKPMTESKLTKSVENMSERLQLPVAPRLYIAEEFPRLFGGKAANAMSFPPQSPEQGGAVVMTERLLKLFDSTPHHFSKEVEGLIAHEMGHVQQGTRHINALRHYPMLLGTAAGFAAVCMYERTLTRRSISTPLLNTIDSAVTEEEVCNTCPVKRPVDVMLQSPHQAVQHATNNFTRAIRLITASAAGTVIGAVATRQFVLKLEHDADMVSAKLMGSPIPLLNAVKAVNEDIQAHSMRNYIEKGKYTLAERFQQLVTHAHPDFASRLEYLNSPRMAEMISSSLSDAARSL